MLDQPSECQKLLKEHPELVNVPLYSGATNPICRAAWLGHRNILSILINAGANIESTSSDGRTPLIWASAKGDIKTMEYLLSFGANLNHTDQDGCNCFDICVIKGLYVGALWLYQRKEMRPKPADFYRDRVVSKHFDFDLFF
jgi:ankyrin repeat protein